MNLSSLVILIIAIAHFIYKRSLHTNMEPVVVVYPKMPKLVGDMKINDRLSYATKLAENRIVGPESFAFYEDAIFTGLLNGSIVKIAEEIEVFYDSEKCPEGSSGICSRPLGLSYNKILDRIILVDAYNGIFTLNPRTAEATKIFPFANDHEFKVTFFNFAVLLLDGRYAVSESSTKFKLDIFLEDLLEGRPNGRILLIDPVSKSWQVLADGLYFPNGLELGPDNQSILVSETAMSRILRISLTTGAVEQFSGILPGFPDNMKASPRGGYWVALAIPRYENRPSFLDILSNWPRLRMFLYKILGPKLLLAIGQLRKHSIVVRLDAKGDVMETLHDTTGHTQDISEAAEHNGFLYLGSYTQAYYGRIAV